MLALWDNAKAGGQTLSVKRIATLLQMDSATVSPMLKRLETLGFVSRTRSATDERTTLVALTEAGVELRQRALRIPEIVIERLGVQHEALEHLHAVLTRNQRRRGGGRRPGLDRRAQQVRRRP
jgi:DNA-binding MarR family transcriptional regulator